MAYSIFLKKSAEKELENIPAKTHDKIIKIITSLKNNPRPYGVKKLYDSKGYRVRVKDYRILYMINDAEKKIEVFSVAHRKEAYQ